MNALSGVRAAGKPKSRPSGGEFEFLAWWTRSRRIRTSAALPVEVPILEIKPPPVYQRIAEKAKHLQELGMTQAEIGRRIGVDRWTVGKAFRWLAQLKRG